MTARAAKVVVKTETLPVASQAAMSHTLIGRLSVNAPQIYFYGRSKLLQQLEPEIFV